MNNNGKEPDLPQKLAAIHARTERAILRWIVGVSLVALALAILWRLG
jgi:hypothetical protein